MNWSARQSEPTYQETDSVTSPESLDVQSSYSHRLRSVPKCTPSNPARSCRQPLIRRLHFCEIEDQTWLPSHLRDAVTDTLRFVFSLGGFYHLVIPYLHKALVLSGATDVIDLCSGSGGPWLKIHRVLAERYDLRIQVYLTDKYPNLAALERLRAVTGNEIIFHSAPVDATRVGKQLKGFRTMFNSFHHFDPEQACAILRDATESREGVAIFEVPRRCALTILLTLLMPIAAFIFAPFILPFRWSRLFWTYLIPVAPLVILFDGIVSCLRAYSAKELAELAGGLSLSDYIWEAGEVRRGISPIPITFLIAWPNDRSATPLNVGDRA